MNQVDIHDSGNRTTRSSRHWLDKLASRPWLYYPLLLLTGAATPLSLSPFNAWWVGILSVSLFALLLTHSHTITSRSAGKHCVISSWVFGLGYFGTGVSWVYVSIYYFGSTPFFLAIILTSIFVSFIALLFAAPFYLLRFITPQQRLLIGIPLLWVLSEWLRTWLLTGFPWLFIGYGHTDTPLAGWAPIGGILFISLCGVFTSVALGKICLQQTKKEVRLGAIIASLWVGGYALTFVEWTQPVNDTPIHVGIVQPNIPQDLRWAPEYQTIIKDRLLSLSHTLWDNDWIIWPEGALPNVYHRSLDLVDQIRLLTQESNTVVISGALYDEPMIDTSIKRPMYFNSIVGIGDSEGIYHKRRLVPFGEYVPLEDWIRGLINFFDLPFSVISSGQDHQKNMRIGEYTLANAICYEIAYPTLVAEQTQDAHVLLTVSNDAWFGHSIGPKQHFQMARMRAMEVGRYVIRGTNNGISAIIAPNGKVVQQAPSFVMTYLEGDVLPMRGRTPFMLWKHIPVLLILLGLAFFGCLFRSQHQRIN